MQHWYFSLIIYKPYCCHIDHSTWLWKGTAQCSGSAMSTSRSGKNGMQANWLCGSRNQNAGGTNQWYSENVRPSLPAFGSTRLRPMRQLRRDDVHLNIQKSSLSMIEGILCEVLSLIWLIWSQVWSQWGCYSDNWPQFIQDCSDPDCLCN